MAIRDLTTRDLTTHDLATRPPAATEDSRDPVIDALAALEAARCARTSVHDLVALLTDRALGQGASFASIGFHVPPGRD
jgi:hypothetical protein